MLVTKRNGRGRAKWLKRALRTSSGNRNVSKPLKCRLQGFEMCVRVGHDGYGAREGSSCCWETANVEPIKDDGKSLGLLK
jgi:hypothetical protein